LLSTAIREAETGYPLFLRTFACKDGALKVEDVCFRGSVSLQGYPSHTSVLSGSSESGAFLASSPSFLYLENTRTSLGTAVIRRSSFRQPCLYPYCQDFLALELHSWPRGGIHYLLHLIQGVQICCPLLKMHTFCTFFLLAIGLRSLYCSATCYDVIGNIKVDLFPCNIPGTSICCEASDFCVNNNFCMQSGNFLLGVYGCTDRHWSSPYQRPCNGRCSFTAHNKA
jgi:hypothetical protein